MYWKSEVFVGREREIFHLLSHFQDGHWSSSIWSVWCLVSTVVQGVGPFATAFCRTFVGSGTEVEHPGLKLAPMWDVGAIGRGLKEPALVLNVFLGFSDLCLILCQVLSYTLIFQLSCLWIWVEKMLTRRRRFLLQYSVHLNNLVSSCKLKVYFVRNIPYILIPIFL